MERIKQAIEKARQQASAQGEAERIPRPTGAVSATPQRQLRAARSEELESVRTVDLEQGHLDEHRIVSYDRDSAFRPEFDLLRTQILQKLDQHSWRTIAITSPSVESGKTVIAINLAMSIAHHPERTVLLVDFDLRRPKVATYLGISGGLSLNDALSGDADVLDCMVRAGLPRFYVLPTLKAVAGAAEILSADRVASIIQDLRARYPSLVIIFDLPPVNVVADAIGVLPNIDCALLVVGSGVSTKRELEECQRHLARTNLVGLVVNKAVVPRRRSAYY
jgi:protein-tyrosine kinase